MAAMVLAGCGEDNNNPNGEVPEVPVETEPGVLIGGVRWAETNVDAPGTFAEKPEDPGMLYQWGTKTAWSTTDPMTSIPEGVEWNDELTGSGSWAPENDPCPEGWRVPTLDEITVLSYGDNVISTRTARNGAIGRVFYDISNGNSIFMPFVVTREYQGMFGNDWGYESAGHYWSGKGGFEGNWEWGYSLELANIYLMEAPNTSPVQYAYSVRCVLDE